MTRRIEPFFITWFKDFFSPKKKTQRIWLFLRLTDLNIFSKKKKMTQRIDPFFSLWLSKWNFFWSTNTTHRTDFFSILLTELKFFFFLKMTFFFDIEFFLIRLKALKFSNTTQRIQLFSLIWLKVLNFFLYDSLNWTCFQEIWLDSSNWTSFYGPLFQDDSKSWSLSFWLKELNLSCFPMWLKELKCFFSKCLKEFNFSFMWTIFVHDSKNLTFFFSIWLKEFNPVLNMINTQRIEPFIIWLKELSLFLIWRNALNFFLVCRTELSLFLNYGSKN